MTVFHGTNCDFNEIILAKGSQHKDFGQGFYVTPDIETAKRMARKKVNLFKGIPTIIEYEFDEISLLTDGLKVKVFPEKATSEWIIFIYNNRRHHSSTQPHSYDIVKGPIADDGVALQLGRLKAHADKAASIALDLQDRYLDQQICFCTEKSLFYLKKQRICILK